MKLVPNRIQSLIVISFTIVTAALTILLSATLYGVFARRVQQFSTDSTEQLLHQTAVTLEDYLVSMRRISDAMYYDVIKARDFASDNVESEMNLIYEAHKDNLVSFALYSDTGSLIAASPVANVKPGLDVRDQEWFRSALLRPENLHFSAPHVQDLFEDPSYRYHWVISLSRAVELTRGGTPALGVLLVDMDYAAVYRMMDRMNQDPEKQYLYLCDSAGGIIYHPRQQQISSGLFKEDNADAAAHADGRYRKRYGQEMRTCLIDTVSYTGWKLVAVIPESAFSLGLEQLRYLVVLLIVVFMAISMLMNQLISSRISSPLIQLDDSIRGLESGELRPEEIYIGGTEEVRHLGNSLRRSVVQINQLMDDIVVEQEEKRKSEMDALQSQINPHFLYNTLDSIVWMIEEGSSKDAVFMVTQLASLFRISLSRGKNIIPIGQELKHAENYMNIQKVRYKNAFQVCFDIDPEIRDMCTVKLVLQPILENAIYYGVEGMDGDGEITVRGGFRDGDINIEVIDNGLGMPEETVRHLLVEEEDEAPRVPKHGSGVGLINVHRRIRLRFGPKYGLEIESEPDEGTTVRICLPAVPATPENLRELEKGHAGRQAGKGGTV